MVPCIPEHRESIYELDENGEAYGNIYELRKVCVYHYYIEDDNVGFKPILLIFLSVAMSHTVEVEYC